MRILNSIPAAALAAALALLGTAVPQTARADDTDLYMSPNKAVGADPLIMFALDYRSNLGSTYDGCTNASTCDAANAFRAYEAAKDQVNALGTGKLTFFDALRFSLRIVFSEYSGFQAGLLLPHNHENNCVGPTETDKCSNGGYIPFGYTDMDADGKEKFLDKLDTLPQTGGTVSHSYQGIEMYFELYRYLKGWAVYNADLGWTDYGSNNSKNIGQNGDTGEFHGVDEDIISVVGGTRTYTNPFGASSACVKTFVINFLFQVTNQENDSDTAIAAAATDAGQGMGFNPANNSTGFPSVVKYLYDNDLSTLDGVQNVVSYFVSTFDNTTTRSYATAGGTSLVNMSEDPEVLLDALRNIFREILSVSTTFVSASVPVNVFNRAESLDNVFIALFQVDADGKPDWIGNMKKLKLRSEAISGGGTSVYLASYDGDADDTNDPKAIGEDGRIKFDAITYWTKTGDLPAAEAGTDEVDGADGRVVDRGAAGQKIPGFIANDPGLTNATAGARQLYYDPGNVTNGASGGTAMTALNADVATAAALLAQPVSLGATHRYAYPLGNPAPTATVALDYLKFLRGYDVTDRDGDTVLTEARPWIWGSPLHSRPLPISYGLPTSYGGSDEENPLIYIAVGGDDGYMRLVQNSIASADDTNAAAGKEVWAFMPQEVMDNVATLYDNSSASSHPYGIDGASTALTIDHDQDGTVELPDGDGNNDSVYLYFGLRRGGRAMYALDISVPTSPTILWRITNETADFSELGYTFSQPKLATVNVDLDADGTASDPVVMFAAGYDPNKDTRGAVGTDDTMGNAFYIVNAKTGALVWKASNTSPGSATNFYHANLTDSISSEVAVIDSDGDGYTDRALFGDTGGQVWRVDFANAVTNWRITLMATLGRHAFGSPARSDDLRFHHRPDLAPSKDSTGSFDAVVIGSGDRENPLDRDVGQDGNSLGTHTPLNYVFMIKDRKTTPYASGDAVPTALTPTDLADLTDNCIELTDCTPPTTISNGWRIALEVGPGEKALSSPLTVTNTVFFTTFLPLGTDDDIVSGSDDSEAATCGPQEGKGLLYAIDLSDATSVTNFNVARDGQSGGSGTRYSQLASAGIPAEVVGVSLGGQAYILPPDLQLEAIQASTRWRTFWYEVEENN